MARPAARRAPTGRVKGRGERFGSRCAVEQVIPSLAHRAETGRGVAQGHRPAGQSRPGRLELGGRGRQVGQHPVPFGQIRVVLPIRGGGQLGGGGVRRCQLVPIDGGDQLVDLGGECVGGDVDRCGPRRGHFRDRRGSGGRCRRTADQSGVLVRLGATQISRCHRLVSAAGRSRVLSRPAHRAALTCAETVRQLRCHSGDPPRRQVLTTVDGCLMGVDGVGGPRPRRLGRCRQLRYPRDGGQLGAQFGKPAPAFGQALTSGGRVRAPATEVLPDRRKSSHPRVDRRQRDDRVGPPALGGRRGCLVGRLFGRLGDQPGQGPGQVPVGCGASAEVVETTLRLDAIVEVDVGFDIEVGGRAGLPRDCQVSR